MTNAYFLSQIAEQDIDDIITYIAQKNPKAAHSFIDTLYETFNTLSDHPYMGHLRKDLTDRPIRFLTFKWHYLVVYNPTQPLEIVRVLSGFRDIVNLLPAIKIFEPVIEY